MGSARRANKEHVGGIFQVGAADQFVYQLGIHPGLGGKVKVLERPGRGQVGKLHPRLPASRFGGLHLDPQQLLDELGMADVFLAGFLQLLRQGLGRSRELQIGQMRAQLLVYGLTVHCKSPWRLSIKRWYTPRSIGGLPVTGDPPMSAASTRAAAEGGRFSLRLQGPLVSKAASTTFSKRPGMLRQAQRAALTGRQDLVGGQQPARL